MKLHVNIFKQFYDFFSNKARLWEDIRKALAFFNVSLFKNIECYRQKSFQEMSSFSMEWIKTEMLLVSARHSWKAGLDCSQNFLVPIISIPKYSVAYE